MLVTRLPTQWPLALLCSVLIGWPCGRLPRHPPAEMFAQLLKRQEKRTWRTELVVREAGGGGVAGGAMVGVASTAGLKVLFPQSVPLRM
jgi:hypothetical protein